MFAPATGGEALPGAARSRLLAGARGANHSGNGQKRWLLLILGLALPALLPVFAVFAGAMNADPELLAHLQQYVLARVAWNTLWLVAGVTLVAGSLGTALAWLIAVYDFPGRRQFAWALLLPMAVPGYVMAFVFIGLFEYAGPVQSLLRDIFGQAIGLPAIRSTGGVILVMSLTLYPYVYLIARNAFETQGRRALEVGQSLGLSRPRAFFRVALPLARPWIAGGVLLVAMETLADFGTVAAFNYDTFTTAIYQAWFSLFSIQSAMQLACVLVLVALLLLLAEQGLRGRARYTVGASGAAPRIRLRPPQAILACAGACTVLGIAFVLPFLQLLFWAAQSLRVELDASYFRAVLNSLILAGGAALLITSFGLLLSYARRQRGDLISRAFARLATIGYALPGTVLAVGLFAPLAAFSNQLTAWLPDSFGIITLQTTLLTLMLAYAARFLAVGHTPVQANMQRITRNLEDAATGMGVTGWRLLTRLHLPVLRGALFTAATLVFVDVMKEMPITLMTRPYGWDTLAVQIYELTAEGRWERAALPGVAIVLAGLIPVMLLTRRGAQSHAA